MTHYYSQITIAMYQQMLTQELLPKAHTYNGYTGQLTIIHMEMSTKELDKQLMPIIAELD